MFFKKNKKILFITSASALALGSVALITSCSGGGGNITPDQDGDTNPKPPTGGESKPDQGGGAAPDQKPDENPTTPPVEPDDPNKPIVGDLSPVFPQFAPTEIWLSIQGEKLPTNKEDYELVKSDGTTVPAKDINVYVPGASVQPVFDKSKFKPGEKLFLKIKNFEYRDQIIKIPGGEPEIPVVPEPKDPILSKAEAITDSINAIGTFNSKTLNTKDRKLNNQYYDTELWTQYHEKYNFVYPGYNRNYEGNNSENKYFGPNKELNGMRAVFNERVRNKSGKEVKFSDAAWITEEIEAGTFKKHRAADTFFNPKISDLDNIKAVEKQITVSTGILGPIPLGLFAPAGEVITLTFDDATFNLMQKTNWKGLSISINENFWDNYEEGNSGQISNRYPFIRSIFKIDSTKKQVKFGTPFGGAITLLIDNSLVSSHDLYNKSEDIKFTIDGAIETLYYYDGQTTEADWNWQMYKVKTKQIAPMFQAVSPYFALNVQFTEEDDISIGHHKIENIIYPKPLFKKWNDFLFLSNYLAGNDLNDSGIQRLNMRFCDDIWGNAGAFGGGMAFSCPTISVKPFLATPLDESFNTDNWLILHEMNHNFEQDAALFKRNTHQETNQVTMFNLSVIGDVTRSRNEFNYTGESNKPNASGWSNLNNHFSTLYKAREWIELNPNSNNDSNYEYSIYSSILHTIGSKNFVDYYRWDVRNHSNRVEGWTGLEEIKVLSERFKLNLWPAFDSYTPYWSDTWPKSYNDATLSEKAIINELKKYPAMDFVANLYAAGSYLYDYQNNNFVYTGDTQAAMEIPAGIDKRLDFDQFILSMNPKFTWNNLQFDKQSKQGGRIELDPTNNKRLIYHPPAMSKEADEFDIWFTPGNWEGKEINYVPQYRYRIKLKQVQRGPLINLYNSNFNSVEDLDKYNGAPNYQFIAHEILPLQKGITAGGPNAMKIKFKFIAREDGDYIFANRWADKMYMKVNGTVVKKQLGPSAQFSHTYTVKNRRKGDTLDIEYLIINNVNENKVESTPIRFDLQIKRNNQIVSDPSKYCLIPNVDTNNLLDNFESRKIDYELYDSSLSSKFNPVALAFDYIDPSQYQLSSVYHNPWNYNDINNLNSKETGELSSSRGDSRLDKQKLEFELNFKKVETVQSLYFGNVTKFATRPNRLKVIGTLDSQEKILYEGIYGAEFGDRRNATTIMNLSQSHQVTKLKIMLETNDVGMILNWFRVGPTHFEKQSNTFGINNNMIKLTDGWVFKKNNDENISAINGLYAVSIKANDAIEFNLHNASRFVIGGQKNTVSTKVDIYINNKLVQQDLDIISNKTEMNAKLFEYQQANKGDMKIKIVHKDNNPLFINYFLTFGENTYLSPVKN